MLAYTPPPTGMPEPFNILSVGRLSMGPVCVASKVGSTSGSQGTASLAYFFPFTITTTRTYVGMIWMNAGTLGGNVNAAIYNADGSAISGAVVGSVAQAGTTAPQQKAFPSPVVLPPGNYFLALSADVLTQTFIGVPAGLSALRAGGARSLINSFALTASAAAWVGTTVNRMPIFGIYEASWL